jgi:hypothetical protein
MKHRRQFPERLIRTLVLTAVCSAAALALADLASATQGINYGNFNPLTGRPYTTADTTIKYGGFNPLTGRPDSAPTPSHTGPLSAPVVTTSRPAALTVRTVVRDHGGEQLTIILAAGAMLIALASTGYTIVRTSNVRTR